MRDTCKTCGASEGFIVYQPIGGICATIYESNGKYAEEQGEMYSGISRGKPRKKLECNNCRGYYGRYEEVEDMLRGE